MIKLTNMTANADGTGYLDFTFDNPEDLARLWSLGSSGVDITGDIKIHVMEDGNLKAALAGSDPAKPVERGPIPPAPQTKPPIPDDVYYSMGNFYSKATRAGMGNEFYKIWCNRALEFQQGYYAK